MHSKRTDRRSLAARLDAIERLLAGLPREIAKALRAAEAPRQAFATGAPAVLRVPDRRRLSAEANVDERTVHRIYEGTRPTRPTPWERVAEAAAKLGLPTPPARRE